MNAQKKFYGKFFLINLVLLLSSGSNATPSDLVPKKFDKDWSYYNDQEVDAYKLKREYEEKSATIFALQQAKKGIINGDLELAKFFLSKISSKKSKLGLVKNRYESIIYFIEGKYKDSLRMISSNEYNEIKNYREICLLRILNLVALDQVKPLLEEVGSCQNLTIQYSTSNQFWLTQLTRIKSKDEDLLKGNLMANLRNALSSVEFSEIWMKMALFLNKEHIILNYVGTFPPATYRSKKVRELIGFAYYRLGKIEKALEFIEDIETPNTDNIRGNINLLAGKYELAFGHFKLALQKKENSQNALQRSIPIAYILGLWDDGLKMLKRIIGNNLNQRRKVSLETLFLIRKSDFKAAAENLLYLESLYNKKLPRQVNLMDSYVALRTGENERLEKASGQACVHYDGLNCWLNLQILHWENIGLTINRDDETLVLNNFDIESLKMPLKVDPLKESIFVDQRDIEELDNEQVRINPNKIKSK
ncbi:MAG: hypothetical protein K9K67_04340 [Bacteriovoracaceae bacterium]|nr:hypothetical protein [Bacteriovoracaceae bacterium]